MDQDVEAILNASDSEEDDTLDVQGVSLEDILREDDGGYMDDELLHDASDDNPPHLRGAGQDHELDRWRTGDGLADGGSPRLHRGRKSADEDRSPLPYRGDGTGGGFDGEAGSGGWGGDDLSPGSFGEDDDDDDDDDKERLSDFFSGDSHEDGGAPPRTAFLNRDQVSEDSRLLQQILKESEEEMAAATEDRAANAGFGMTKVVAGGGGAGAGGSYGGGGYRGYGDTGAEHDGANLQSLDVDRIIESMEQEVGEEGGSRGRSAGGGMPSWPAAAGASASRRRSFTTDVSGGGGGGGGIAGPDYDAVSRPRDRGASLGGSSTATAQGLSVDRGSGSHSTPDTQGVAVPQGGPGDALAVDPPAGGGSGGLGSLRARRTSNGGRSGGALLPSAVTGDVKGVSGGGDWGLTGAMRKAEAGELRLLRGGNREIISPLQVKRRMRAPPPPPPAGQPSPGFPGIGGGVGGGVGVVRMENLEAASRQLARNAAYGKHGPGVCTATAAHSKFIAVGTSRGLILLFDHFQEIRHVLGSAGGGGADGVPADDPVTSLDMCVASDCLLAGHGSGRILLWDYLRGVVLKAVVDLHSSAVVSVRCFVQGGGGGEGGGGGGGGGGSSDPAAITADVEGVVNKLCFRRVMWTKWVVDTECLLDGAAGPIPALCVLPSWTDSAASTSGTATAGGGRRNGAISGVSPGFHDIGMMAMSSWKNTFIVGIYPEVKVVHKWPRPPLGAGGTDHLPPPCLSWGPPQPSAARAHAPPMALLARGWGNSIQILAATRVDTGSGGRGRGGGGGRGGRGGAGPRGSWREGGGAGVGAGVRWPSLAVVKELSASAPVVAVEWLREQVLAYLDTDMELCVLDTRAGTELEHASLSTLGVSISPIIPQPNSSQAASSMTGFSAGGTKDNAGGNPRGHGGGERAELAPTPTSAPAPLGTYHNAFRACEGRLYLLGRQELRAVRVQGWSQRVESLVQAGEWLEALAVALDHFEQKILPAENAAAAAAAEAAAATAAVLATFEGGAEWTGGSSAHGGGGGGQGMMNSAGDRDPWGRDGGGFGGERSMVGAAALGSRVPGDQLLQQQQPQRRPAPRSEAAEHISDLLAQYLRLAMNNAPAAESSSAPGLGPPLSSGGGSRINLAHSHFQMLAGVCLEYCAVTGRLDMLFGQVFNAFRARGQQGVFLDTLEPYVLMGKLKTLSPETLGAFVDRCQSGGDMIAAERLVLRLEPRALDLASALPLLRRHRLFSALLAVRASRGDYTSSVDEVLREAMSIAERDRPHAALSSSGNGLGGGADPSSCSPSSAERAPGDGGAELRPYPADPTFDELGHKVLLYLTRCFRGRMLGSSEPLSDGETAKARANLLHLLVQPSLSSATALTSTVGREGRPAKHASSSTENRPSPSPWKGAVFPYLSILLYVDAGAAIDVLSIAMDSPDAVFRETGGSTIPSPISPASAVPTSFRQSATVPRGRGREAGDDMAEGRGGVWGKRIGKGRARAIGWAGAPAPAASGAGAEGGGVGGEGWTESRVGGKSAEVIENVCPSRRTIVEAVTSVLAPNLSGQADRAMEAMMMATGSPFPGSGGGNSPQDDVGLSAGAFVHSPRGGLSSGTKDGLRDGTNGNGGGGGEDDRSGAAWHESPSSRLRDRDGQEWWAAARPRLFDFVAKYLELSLVSVGPRLTNAVLVGVAKEVGGGGAAAAASGQARLVTLLQRVPLSLVDRDTLLPLAEKSRFFRAAVILLKAAVTLGEQKGFTLEEFARIVRCYLQDSEDTFRMQVFAFIRQEVARSTSMTAPPKSRTSPSREGSSSAPGGGSTNKEDQADGAGAELLEKREVVLSELPRLMELNKAEAVFTVGEAFRGDHKAALDALSSTTTLQFEYLDALLRPSQGSPSAASLSQGTETDGDKKSRGGRRWGGTSPVGGGSGRPSRAPTALAAGLDERDRSLHIRLLVKFRPYEVYPFLSGSTGYSLDDTLALCQERGVADATAYLLERKGDVPGALALALRTLSARLASLRTALQAASLRDVAAEMAFIVPGSPSKRPPTGEDGARPVMAKSLSGSGLGGFGAVAGGGSGGAPRAGTAAWARWASKVALEGLQEGREAIRSLMVAIEMCQRASPATGATVGPTSLRPPGARSRATNGPGSAGGEARSRASTDPFDDDGDLDLSASLWFQTLDKILSAKGAACRSDPNSASSAGSRGGAGVPGDMGGLAGRGRAASRAATAATAGGELPQTAAVMGGVLDALLQRTLSSMAGYVPLPAIVKKVVSDHAGSSLGEFRHVILAMLDTYSYDTAIHRTAASLLFDSLRTVVRERHTLKGAGVRVSAVAGLELNPARDAEFFGAAPPAKSADSEDFRGGGTRAPPPPTLPPGLLDAVGSGVISVSPSGQALVEHLGQGGAGSGGREDGAGSGGGGGGSGVAGSWPSRDQPGGCGGPGAVVSPAGVTAFESRGASKQEASASLWRLRAARRRRQARGDKMRSLVTWAAGDEGPAWNASAGGGGGGAGGMHGNGERGGGRGRGPADPSPRGRFVGRSGGVDGESGASRTPGTKAKSSTGGSGQQASETEQGQQAVGWGVALQARARAIPASFMPKRT